jgi:hypothetical protein
MGDPISGNVIGWFCVSSSLIGSQISGVLIGRGTQFSRESDK